MCRDTCFNNYYVHKRYIRIHDYTLTAEIYYVKRIFKMSILFCVHLIINEQREFQIKLRGLMMALLVGYECIIEQKYLIGLQAQVTKAVTA